MTRETTSAMRGRSAMTVRHGDIADGRAKVLCQGPLSEVTQPCASACGQRMPPGLIKTRALSRKVCSRLDPGWTRISRRAGAWRRGPFENTIEHEAGAHSVSGATECALEWQMS